jgi:hypothetical protein
MRSIGTSEKGRSLPPGTPSSGHRLVLVRSTLALFSEQWSLCPHEDLPGRALASSAVVTTAACFAMTLSSSMACTSASGSAQQSRTTTNR